MSIGAHVSIAGGIENAPERAKELAAECFQLFTRSPHGGSVKKLEDDQIEKFLHNCQQYNFTPGQDYVTHTPYYINLASENNRIYYGSISSLRLELETATRLQAPFVITHLGSSKDLTGENIQKQINTKIMKALEKIHQGYQGSAQLLLEIAAGSGNIIGDSFEEIAYFLSQAKKKKIALGFCFDTCHSFTAGYDLRTLDDVDQTFEKMDQTIGIENLKVIHLNDSQADFNSKVDRHEHLGQGKIGQAGIARVIQLAKNKQMPIIIETKHDQIKGDIAMAKNICG